MTSYIELLLTDSNLPTGSFVASSGLESFLKHGFLSSQHISSNLINFIQDSLQSYARSALPFVSDAHRVVEDFSSSSLPGHVTDSVPTAQALSHIKTLDALYDSMTLNHVAKRASKSQGVALLTLHSKGFSKPSFLAGQNDVMETHLLNLVDQLKSAIRRDEMEGHLPVCWGVLTGALGLSLGTHLCFPIIILINCAFRTRTVSPPILTRSLAPFRCSSPKHLGPLWCPTTALTCCPTAHRSRGGAV
jgi:urease accessory protein